MTIVSLTGATNSREFVREAEMGLRLGWDDERIAALIWAALEYSPAWSVEIDDVLSPLELDISLAGYNTEEASVHVTRIGQRRVRVEVIERQAVAS